MSDLNIHTFNVGQGLFNFVCEKYTDTEGEKTYCGIIDCGSHSRTKHDFQFRIEEIAQRMRAAYNNSPLDYVVISHQDEDHWNYLIEFLENYYDFSFSEWNVRYKRNKNKSLFRLVDIEYNNRSYSCGEQCSLWVGRYFLKRIYFINDYYEICDNSFPEMHLFKQGETIKYKFDFGRKCCVVVNAVQDENGSIQAKGCKIIEGQFSKEWNYSVSINPDSINKQEIASYLKDCAIFGKMGKSAIQSMLERVMIDLNLDVVKIMEGGEKEIKIRKILTGGFEWEIGAEKTRKILGLIWHVSNLPCSLYQVENRKWHFVCDDCFYDVKNLKEPSIKKNASSLMIHYICSQNDTRYEAFFPGDATHHTFDKCNEKINECTIDYLVAPHHGSFKTNIVVNGDNEELPYVKQPISKFIDLTEPQNVAFSARHDVFGHPNTIVAYKLSSYVKNVAPMHRYVTFGQSWPTALEWEKVKNQCCFCETTENSFTTEYNGDITFINGDVTIENTEENGTGAYDQMVHNFIIFDDMFV